jgi:hypothetical protein
LSWLALILGLALLVFLYELGHFTVARLVGVKRAPSSSAATAPARRREHPPRDHRRGVGARGAAVYAPFSRFGMASIVVRTLIALSNDVGAPLR